ncbi:MAG: aminotransferase class I/II-fold pyridoxal phosphate-dependent enzyme [Leptospiraceae bacterium]|nr:aminotransferase class I/II-fold pyridoxal phosphate-dependent enzyme [Leptospiraceae bacterium]MCP5511978.1 aminotransferase class I/II-fold pyridoxal phosphate-dependent enzyme [Leptospiraceae bacterium]
MSRIDSSPIRKAFELAATLKNPINLSIGQPHFPCPENILDAMDKAARDGKTSYTLSAGIPILREAIAEKYRSFNKISNAEPKNVLITSGVSSALLLLFNAFLDPADTCLIISPYFLMYPSMIRFNGGNVITLDENFSESDLEELKNKKIKFIIYSSPSNPSGKILTLNQLKALANFAENSGAIIISDEIYELFDYDNNFLSIGSFYDKVITLSGFSKSYNMTGLRLASILAPESIITALTTLQQYTIVCAPSVVQYAGLEALKTDMTSYIYDYREKRDFVFDSLKEKYTLTKSQGAFYYFLKIPGNDEEFIKKAILEHSLILVPGYIFHPTHNYVRISFATEWDQLKAGVSALLRMV